MAVEVDLGPGGCDNDHGEVGVEFGGEQLLDDKGGSRSVEDDGRIRLLLGERFHLVEVLSVHCYVLGVLVEEYF